MADDLEVIADLQEKASASVNDFLSVVQAAGIGIGGLDDGVKVSAARAAQALRVLLERVEPYARGRRVASRHRIGS